MYWNNGKGLRKEINPQKLRRIRVCLQGTLADSYRGIFACECNAVDEPEDKQDWGFIFFRSPNIVTHR